MSVATATRSFAPSCSTSRYTRTIGSEGSSPSISSAPSSHMSAFRSNFRLQLTTQSSMRTSPHVSRSTSVYVHVGL